MTTPRRFKEWTAAEDDLLRTRWGDTLRSLSLALGRTELGVYWRGRELGLRVGAPQGYEYLTAAAARTGYSPTQLRRVLRAACVRLHRTISRPGTTRRRSYHFVDPLDVDDAVAAWCKQETVAAAARRHGIADEVLKRLLIKSGFVPPERTGSNKKPQWRVEPDAVDKLVAAYRHPTVAAHAARLGLDKVTLAKKLRRAGVLGAKHPGAGGVARLPIEVVDRAVGRAA